MFQIIWGKINYPQHMKLLPWISKRQMKENKGLKNFFAIRLRSEGITVPCKGPMKHQNSNTCSVLTVKRQLQGNILTCGESIKLLS